MSQPKKHTQSKPSRSGNAAKEPAGHDWVAPIDADAPCGPDLEYDPEFVVLFARVAPKAEAQYGNFVGTPDPVNWSDIDRDCRRLMMRSKDVRLAILFARCRTRLAGATGLAEGTHLLAAWLAAFPKEIHPQLGADDDPDGALEIRMNALQALTDAEGLLGDVREIVLAKAMATRLQVRDVERAFAHPRPSDALAPESVNRQLADLRVQQPANMAGFDEARHSLAEIQAWCTEHLYAYCPDLSPMERLLSRLACADAPTLHTVAEHHAAGASGHADDGKPAQHTAQREESSPYHGPAEPAFGPAHQGAGEREDAVAQIRQARLWFERHEPSSPIPVLLQRAEQFVGKRYAEIIQAIPAELLAQWESAASEDS
ncbi:ImpA family type VI secretion system protein [Ralstonia sp. UBA689]|uniref:type VI secretion system protein TssA n=1 Tax=Ralstonia sp. UBA689 TaxID=1947373 RepID=UPI0025DB6D69|nr:type VI secretion system ImpA family N-terminal domain-containing protein [Ralstonia sp. UBA689]